MDLRRVRLRLTALNLVLFALAIGVVSALVLRAGQERIDNAEQREAQVALGRLLVDRVNGGDEPPENTWLVDVEGKKTIPLGDSYVEPPLLELAREAGDGTSFGAFDTKSDGRWMAATQKLNLEFHAVAAIDVRELEAERSSFRTNVLLVAFALVVACALASYWFAGRALGPARRAMEQQRDFIADAAHELRTPLAVIRASASHVLSRPRENLEYQQSLGEILAAAERAGVGVGELLELARLDAGQARPRLAPLRLDLLVEEVAAAIRVDAVEITAQEGEALVVDADYALLHQVIETLTRNAAARSAHVRLSTAPVADRAVIEIRDDGPGFDPKVLPHVFDRFRRGDRKGSTGLGMAIAKSIVEAHGGEISAANAPEGGALVRIALRRSGA